ncbi:MAG TPA: hypothetical protein VHE78_14745 [Gemmatimonadaceae bacterium]|nr:hypothetical protein [Gemmatimonadaceae bacterium]
MYRRVSPALRAGRALTALVTVWCLGCAGFEPLLNALLGSNAGSRMACTSEAGRADEQSAMDGSDLPMHSAAVSPPADDHRGFDCGCGQSCQATSLASQAIAPRTDPTPRVAANDVKQPPSVVRTPLPPPPEQTTS